MAPSTDKSASKKPKLVRDSFTIPKNEFAAIDTLKTRAIALGVSVKKSELLRAGLMVLQDLSDAAYKAAVAAVPTLKTGRPAAEASAAKPAAPAPKEAAAKAAVKKPAAKKSAAKKPAVKKPAVKKAVAKKAAKPAAKAAAKATPPVASTRQPTRRKAPAKAA